MEMLFHVPHPVYLVRVDNNVLFVILDMRLILVKVVFLVEVAKHV